MTFEERERFNFLEAAARVWLSHTKKRLLPCVTEYRKSFINHMNPLEFMVKYKTGHNYIIATINEQTIVFRPVRGSRFRIQLTLDRVKQYVDKHPTIARPPLIIN